MYRVATTTQWILIFIHYMYFLCAKTVVKFKLLNLSCYVFKHFKNDYATQFNGEMVKL